MKVLITGGWGFLGTQLAKLLLKRKSIHDRHGELVAITEIVLFDAVNPPVGSTLLANKIITSHIGDMTDPATCGQLVNTDDMCVFHLAGAMSGACEKDFDLGWRVNVMGAYNILHACRARNCRMRIVFASTIAVFGETTKADEVVSDATKLRPTNTYGMTKATCELLVNEMTRKGYIDGRVARLPTVIVRPGLPNAASTSCFSGIVREPLAGINIEIPVKKDQPHAIIGLRCCVKSILDVHEIPRQQMEEVCRSDRAINLPSLSATLEQIAAAMQEVAANKGIQDLGTIVYKPDDFLSGLVASMASATDFSRATALGLEKNPGLVDIISQYFDDFGVAGSGLYKK